MMCEAIKHKDDKYHDIIATVEYYHQCKENKFAYQLIAKHYISNKVGKGLLSCASCSLLNTINISLAIFSTI